MARPRRNERAWKRFHALVAPGSPLRLKSHPVRAIKGNVASQNFTFRLERVRSLRERAEEAAREVLARELTLRIRGEAILREAAAPSAPRATPAATPS